VNTCIGYRLAPTVARVSELEDFRAVHEEMTWSLKQVDSLGLSRKNCRQMDLRCAPFKATGNIGSDCVMTHALPLRMFSGVRRFGLRRRGWVSSPRKSRCQRESDDSDRLCRCIKIETITMLKDKHLRWHVPVTVTWLGQPESRQESSTTRPEAQLAMPPPTQPCAGFTT
jgi:hypothetical protein